VPLAAFAGTEVKIYHPAHSTYVYLHQVGIAFGAFDLLVDQAVIAKDAFNVFYNGFFRDFDRSIVGKDIQIRAKI
jgi:hypothetical protein